MHDQRRPSGPADLLLLARRGRKGIGSRRKFEEATVDGEEKIIDALRITPVGDIWGVGYQYARKLKEDWGIYDALQLRNVSEEFATTYLGGVTGTRLIRELKGKPSKEMEEELVTKKMIATTRMFGSPVGDIASIKEAIATYTSRAAEKLRRQHGAARVISIFVVAKDQNHTINFRDRGQSGMLTKHIILPTATSFTNELIKPAVSMVDTSRGIYFFQKQKIVSAS